MEPKVRARNPCAVSNKLAPVLSQAPWRSLGPDGPIGRRALAPCPEPARWPAQPQRTVRGNGLWGQSCSSGPELLGLLPPQVLSMGDGARLATSSPEVRAHPPQPPSRARSGPARISDRARTLAPSSASVWPSPRPRRSSLAHVSHGPHMTSAPPASRARSLGLRAR